MKRSCWVFLVGVALSALLSGCASTSVFIAYPTQLKPVKQGIEAKELEKPAQKMAKNHKSADKILYLQESGRIAALNEDPELSIAYFDQAQEAIEANRAKSDFDLGGTVASVFTNDNAIPYKGETYEKVFIHTYQALNYLKQRSLEGALVEVRRAASDQELALLENEKELMSTDELATEEGVDQSEVNDSLDPAYARMAETAGKVKNSFQNAYTFYLSGVLYEMDGKPNDAFIDYKKALEIFPGNSYVIDAAFRTAEQVGLSHALADLRKRYGDVKPQKPSRGEGRLVIIYEDGFVPERESFFIPFFWSGRSYTIAMPFYASEWHEPQTARVYVEDRYFADTQPICYVRALAVKALMEKYPGIFIRQLLRLVAKHIAQKQAQQANGVLGLVTMVASLLTEGADRRSWLTLPDNVQIADYFVAAGDLSVELSPGGTPLETQVLVLEGKTTILHVSRFGSSYYVNEFLPTDQ